MNLTSKKDEKGKVRRKEDEIKKKIAPKKNKKTRFWTKYARKLLRYDAKKH